MITLLAWLLRIFLLAAFTFAFVVLFEHGPAKFPENAATEANRLLASVRESEHLRNLPGIGSHSPPPTPSAAVPDAPVVASPAAADAPVVIPPAAVPSETPLPSPSTSPTTTPVPTAKRNSPQKPI